MGLDVGVVKFQYLDSPDELLREFLRHLRMRTQFDDEIWQVSEGMNTIVEVTRPDMLRHATEFVSEDEIDKAGEQRIMDWIRDLPWDEGMGDEGEDVIALHVSW